MKKSNDKNYTLKPKTKSNRSINFNSHIYDTNYDEMITNLFLKEKENNKDSQKEEGSGYE